MARLIQRGRNRVVATFPTGKVDAKIGMIHEGYSYYIRVPEVTQAGITVIDGYAEAIDLVVEQIGNNLEIVWKSAENLTKPVEPKINIKEDMTVSIQIFPDREDTIRFTRSVSPLNVLVNIPEMDLLSMTDLIRLGAVAVMTRDLMRKYASMK